MRLYSPIKERSPCNRLRTLYIIGKNVGVCQGISTSFFFPLLLCKAENITVIVCLKTGEEKVTERVRKREEEGIEIEV